MSIDRSESSGRWVEARASHSFSHASADRVYDAWLDPGEVRAWMPTALRSLGLEGDVQRVQIEPRIGGRFCFSDLRHGTEAVHHGEYLELVRPRRIAFTWIVGEDCDGEEEDAELPSQVTLTLQPAAGGCSANIVHRMDARWAEYVSRTETGWTRLLQAVDSHCRSATTS